MTRSTELPQPWTWHAKDHAHAVRPARDQPEHREGVCFEDGVLRVHGPGNATNRYIPRAVVEAVLAREEELIAQAKEPVITVAEEQVKLARNRTVLAMSGDIHPFRELNDSVPARESAKAVIYVKLNQPANEGTSFEWKGELQLWTCNEGSSKPRFEVVVREQYRLSPNTIIGAGRQIDEFFGGRVAQFMVSNLRRTIIPIPREPIPREPCRTT